ncbi:hypothetical protein BACCIP111895_00947 [Neobacillus rhizosphaerae]|uniref:Ethanolamine utilization protein n=1 Tax=Neobacillus rhizosphaerae TaxID=2880965 RepID=A0ABM9EMG3_9BACI|nr:hypothetical protein [Neobacillus rhizosphaerae]CAH2713793.1 hypothetical protein BACCIP111895_00947 [Neobacillus rhizosphaerae]
MIDRNWIEQIVLEVVKQLSSTAEKPLESSKPTLLVVGDTSFIDPKPLQLMKTKWNAVSCNADETVKLDMVDKVVFLHATQDLLVKGVLGIFDTPESKLLSRCILESVPVSIIPTVYLQEHLFNVNPKNRDYVSQLIGYKETLMKYGVEVESFEGFVGNSAVTVSSDVAKDPIFKKKKLLTQRDVRDCKEVELMVDPSTIITPLARDTARELGKTIKVIK